MISANDARGFQVLAGFLLLLLSCNQHLITGTTPSALIYNPEMVALGEWWRLVTHPFVHVGWYHLIMDGAAVVTLWYLMSPCSRLMRAVVAACSGVGCLAAVALLSADADLYGFCGLSGVAHGLSIYLGLSWLCRSLSRETLRKERNSRLALVGGLLVLISVTKVMIEVSSGTVLFAEWHAGELGVPLVESHLGGLLGGIMAFLLLAGGGKKC